MQNTFYIKRGDTAPRMVFALLPTDIDLTGATVRFSMKLQAGNLIVVNRAPAIVVTATVTPTVGYSWQPGDTATEGIHEAEFEVTYPDARVESFPNSEMILVMVTKDIA